MPKKWASGDEDSRGAKAKAQKAEAAERRDADAARKRAKEEEAEWSAGVNRRAEARAEADKARREEKERREREKHDIAAREAAEGGASIKRGEKGLVRGLRAAAGDKVSARREKAVEDAAAELAALRVDRAFVGSGLDAALGAMESAGLGGRRDAERHPERRRKAAFREHEQRELVRLRDERPGLKLSQYKELIFKAWQKAPENPMNSGDVVAFNAKRDKDADDDDDDGDDDEHGAAGAGGGGGGRSRQ
jgi:hypothetical protein